MTTKLIEAMEKLFSLHEHLLTTAAEKTEAIQTNDMQEISRLLREEQKLVTAIQIAENSRQKATASLANGNVAEPLSNIIEKMFGQEREQLETLQAQLQHTIAELKSANALNQQLLQYSLQFVHLNLDLLAPEPELPNYSKGRNEEAEFHSGRSLFDSKA